MIQKPHLICLKFFAAFLVILIMCNASFGQEESPNETLDPSLVIGGSDTFDLPGSGFVIDTEELRLLNYYNINQVLNKVPGVYFREEDGYGNFPNISIRGAEGTRSDNVTIMEDGILTAPAAYSAPSAYYSPNPARMGGIEILKGSSQIAHGPHTTGGVVNYLSTQFPTDHSLYLRSTYGSNNAFDFHGYWSDKSEGSFGEVGILTELYYRQTDGFRTIDAGKGYSGSDKTGFDVIEPMLKFYWEPNSDFYQRWEFKYGYSDFNADETYAGLAEAELKANPFRRYAGTFLDNMVSDHKRSYLKYFAEPSDKLSIQIAAYYNEFKRDWYKINKAGGQSIYKVIANPTNYTDAFDDLRLLGTGSLGIKHNSRSYDSRGAQFNFTYAAELGGLSQNITGGTRFHKDSIRRFQQQDTIDLSGELPVVNEGLRGSGGNRFQEAESISFWIEDEIDFGALTITPGIRYEHIKLDWIDYISDSTNTVKENAAGDIDAIVPGIGMVYALSESTNTFGGVYKGISTPSPRGFLKSGTKSEESIGYEFGIRKQHNRSTTEIAAFLSDYDQLTGSNDGLGGLAFDFELDASNAGEAEVKGIELVHSYTAQMDNVIQFPLFVSATYTDARLTAPLSEGGEADILAADEPGARIPYVPEWKLSMGAGIDAENWAINIVGSYISDMYATAKNIEISSGREGKIDEGFTLDLSAHYQLNDTTKIIGGVHNVLDDVYTVSRLPDGPRVNAPREFYVGLEIKW